MHFQISIQPNSEANACIYYIIILFAIYKSGDMPSVVDFILNDSFVSTRRANCVIVQDLKSYVQYIAG